MYEYVCMKNLVMSMINFNLRFLRLGIIGFWLLKKTWKKIFKNMNPPNFGKILLVQLKIFFLSNEKNPSYWKGSFNSCLDVNFQVLKTLNLGVCSKIEFEFSLWMEDFYWKWCFEILVITQISLDSSKAI